MRLITAAIAAFLLLPFFGMTAYATELEEVMETPAAVATEDAPETDAPAPDETPDMDPDAPVTDYPKTPPNPLTPAGTATVIDYATDSEGKLFYTIMTPDEHVFYLVIDKQRNSENVYFLNTVTIADLAALAELPAQKQTPGGMVTPQPTAPSGTNQPVETPPPEAEQPESGGNTGMYIFIIAIAVIGGGAGWYFKIEYYARNGPRARGKWSSVTPKTVRHNASWSNE
jgi:hypothetical protein